MSNINPKGILDAMVKPAKVDRSFEESKKLNSKPARKLTPYERTKAQVYATGNKWAIENFHATHD